MSTRFEDVQRQVLSLSEREKATLARMLIDALDASEDGDVEELWLQEAQRRYDEYLAGRVEARSGPDVMARARQRLK